MDLNLITRLESYSADLFKLPDRRRLAVISEGNAADENESLAADVDSKSGSDHGEPERGDNFDTRKLPPSRTNSFSSMPASVDDANESLSGYKAGPVTTKTRADAGAHAARQVLRGGPERRRAAAHYDDLWGAITRNIGKGFVLGYAGKVFLNSLFPLLDLARGRRTVVNRRVLFIGAREYGLFLGSLLAIFNGGMFASRKLPARWAFLRRYRAFISGLAAGSALLWIPRPSRWAITLFALVRAFELQIKLLAARKVLPTLENADTMLMSVASASMLHSWMFSPDTLDPSYVRFLNVHSQMPAPVRESLASIYTGDPLPLAALAAARSRMAGSPRVLREPLGADSWPGGELMHPTMSLAPFAVKFFVRAMQKSVPVYLPVFSVPILLFYPQSLVKRPVSTVKRVLQGVLRSSIFLSLYCTIGFCSVSAMRSLGLTRTRAGPFGQTVYMFAGLWAGLATLIEKKNRRIELALYVFSKAVEGRWNYVVSRNIVRPIRNGEVLVFAYCFAIVTHCYTRHPTFLRSAYSSVLNKFFDTDKRHEFYAMPRIVSERFLSHLSVGSDSDSSEKDLADDVVAEGDDDLDAPRQ
ncbi:Transmembrane protein 135 [Hondaea fermentalgiana]|uniref:Transmembrane protein 135 n=1 Tax=Hondaea fermentalgiana TaxID=2315210 RepID=A0A2R5H2H7_9STRA|nr:Transmembrane protein 135 [Hondaea fermentalgiana]|eukprot:GBG34594.1 Transmembrane protein 135 [Hondaea fermentalgiana]